MTRASIARLMERPAPHHTETRRRSGQDLCSTEKSGAWRHLALLTSMALTLAVTSVLLPGNAHAITPDSKPVASSDSFSYKQQNNLSVPAPGVLANDNDADGDHLLAQMVLGPSFGVVTGFYSSGAFTYVPYSHAFVGADHFSYRVWDGTQYSDPAEVFIYALPTNTAPVAQPDEYKVIENSALSVAAPGVLANDGDPDGDGVTFAHIQTYPTHGTVSDTNAIGHFAYTPQAGFVGYDTFTYAITDGHLLSNPATVSVHVMPLQATAHNDAYSIAQDQPLDVASPGVLKNDLDPNGYPMTLADITQQPSHGSVLWYFSTGGFHYVPNAGFFGTDTFHYDVISDNQKSAAAAVTITVKQNQKPVAHNDSFMVAKNGKLTVTAPGVLKNDTDADKDKISVATYSSHPAHGTLSGQSARGSFSYIPKKGFVGQDHFTYQVADGHINGTASATVNITVK